jgi:hypothetical protein
MLSFLPVIVCGLLELKRICVGSLLIVWDGNESVQEFYYLLGVDANLCRIFMAAKQQTKFGRHIVFAPFLIKSPDEVW